VAGGLGGDVGEGTILIAGGGTGGHLYPGIAIAHELQDRREGLEIIFAAAGLPLERDILGRHGYPLLAIASGGVVGKSLTGRLRGGLRAIAGLLQSLRALLRIKPKMIIGVGGYASGPMVMAGVVLRRPTLIHEQNYYPGLTNRLLAPWVSKVATSFEETRRYFGGRGVLTGNPIRSEFRAVRSRARGDPFHVLIFGGSQGSRALNGAILDALPHLQPHRAELSFLHGTGPADRERVSAAYASLGFEATVREYLREIREAYELADLVIARSGASTVSEIAACGRASILVPLPTAAHDHQRFNARKLEATGAAILLDEATLTGESLARAILSLRAEPERVEAMESAALSLARPDAAARIADLAEELWA
jgi:UDP-N-acetylglucosamine--N-acetylmuramyl-(pentapeptide) pyrophosphoryl-undecaprenol N-acetylglucosamine transferase